MVQRWRARRHFGQGHEEPSSPPGRISVFLEVISLRSRVSFVGTLNVFANAKYLLSSYPSPGQRIFLQVSFFLLLQYFVFPFIKLSMAPLRLDGFLKIFLIPLKIFSTYFFPGLALPLFVFPMEKFFARLAVRWRRKFILFQYAEVFAENTGNSFMDQNKRWLLRRSFSSVHLRDILYDSNK